ncbi:MAG: nitric oxide synthase oxygenase [Rhodobacterales bacterium]|nr:nitric oxide synthase oxygenase [Rhodobacterales bacterium]
MRRLSAGEKRAEARAFLTLFHDETGRPKAERRRREAEVERDLKRSGTCIHTPDELAFGGRVAWRNHAQCIGRLFWRSLEVRDRREITDPDAIAEDIAAHMRRALNGDKIRSVITTYAPATPTSLPAHVGAGQITRYAGHIQRDGSVIGDRANVGATREAEASGWRGSGGPFDVLPVPVITADGRRLHRMLPNEVTRYVQLEHPRHTGFGELGLQWYGAPCVLGMILTIGGIDHPFAPFNGFYMGTEIASRNLADPWRYDLLAPAARTFNIDPEGADPLWRDRALTELNAAVLHSYHKAGVTLIDHHAAARDFMRFCADEAANGRAMHADWAWIVPPQAGAATAPFHVEMQDGGAVPNFYHGWMSGGWALMPYDGDRSRSRYRAHLWAARRWLLRRMRQRGALR